MRSILLPVTGAVIRNDTEQSGLLTTEIAEWIRLGFFPGGFSPGRIVAENKDSSVILAGMAVAAHSSGSGVVKANASNNGTLAIGLAAEDINPTEAGDIQLSDYLSLTDWSAVFPTGLMIGTVYFLSLTSGLLSSVAPTLTGQYIQPVAKAIRSDTLELILTPTVLL